MKWVVGILITQFVIPIIVSIGILSGAYLFGYGLGIEALALICALWLMFYLIYMFKIEK